MTHEIPQNSGMIPYNEALAWASQDGDIARLFRGASGFIPLEVSRDDIDRQLKRRGVATVSEVVYPDPETHNDARIIVGCYLIPSDGGNISRVFGLLQFKNGSMYVSDRENPIFTEFFSGGNE